MNKNIAKMPPALSRQTAELADNLGWLDRFGRRRDNSIEARTALRDIDREAADGVKRVAVTSIRNNTSITIMAINNEAQVAVNTLAEQQNLQIATAKEAADDLSIAAASRAFSVATATIRDIDRRLAAGEIDDAAAKWLVELATKSAAERASSAADRASDLKADLDAMAREARRRPETDNT